MFSSTFTRFNVLFRFVVLAAVLFRVQAFDNSRSDNMAIYWGQGQGSGQKALSAYCSDDNINAIPIAFVYKFFSTGGLPALDLSDTCSVSGNGAFHGTALPKCEFLADDIKTCQENGKIVTISLGGADASVGFTSAEQAQKFADTIWNTFLGGSSDTRPFGDAVLDGIDLDIENGSHNHYSDFVTQIRSHTDSADKKYYVTAAPQCVFPDEWVGDALDSVAFDAVYVQYNNDCGLQEYNKGAWNFATWDKWAKSKAKNSDVKIYIGAPASHSSAGSGYVDAGKLGDIANAMSKKYTTFGGIMLWDMSSSYANDKFHDKVKAAMGSDSNSKRSEVDISDFSINRRSDRFAKIAARQADTAMISGPIIKRSADEDGGSSVERRSDTLANIAARQVKAAMSFGTVWKRSENENSNFLVERRSDRFAKIAARQAEAAASTGSVQKRSEDNGGDSSVERRSDRFAKIAARRQSRNLS